MATFGDHGPLSWISPTRTAVARWCHQWPGCLDRPMSGKTLITSLDFCLCVLVVRHIGITFPGLCRLFTRFCISKSYLYLLCELQIILWVVSLSFVWQHNKPCLHTLLTKALRKPVLPDLLARSTTLFHHRPHSSSVFRVTMF